MATYGNNFRIKVQWEKPHTILARSMIKDLGWLGAYDLLSKLSMEHSEMGLSASVVLFHEFEPVIRDAADDLLARCPVRDLPTVWAPADSGPIP